jgi:hypothetical protein
MSFPNVPSGNLPSGFVAIDVLKALQLNDGSLSLYDPLKHNERVAWWSGHYPSGGHAIIGVPPGRPHVTIEARGGYDIIYLATADRSCPGEWCTSRESWFDWTRAQLTTAESRAG